ncbi:NnrU family protein [Saccharospirillum mangrovi]|uniref:NnrU family protein n=1 Tax=Saccharospirillum mangrovi TaxID=2161747 RepID=UPI000D349FB8|nr:NnrU family protein [Saccharospirillum mangrovi]
MAVLILGLVLFLGVHSVRIVAPQWRLSMLERLGEQGWKGLYTVVSLAGFALLVWGYSLARLSPTWLWVSPAWTYHVTALLMLVAFILLAAAYVPGNRIKAKLGHPMLLATKTWAFAHLLSNGTLADLVLFGSFLVWAIADFAVSRRRDRTEGVTYPVLGIGRDAAAIVVGVVAYVVFALWLHGLLIGVRPFG